MFSDFIIVAVFAAIGVAVVYFTFLATDKAVVVEKPKAVKADKPKKAQPSKAELKKKEQEEKELEALIAREAKGTKGMHTSGKFEVESLEAHREKVREKQRNGKSAATVAAETKTVFTEEEKVKERAAGFKVVTEVEKEKKPASPKTGSPTHTGTRGASPKTSAASARDELDRKLALFFKSANGKKKDTDFDPAKKEVKTGKVNTRIEIKKAIGAANEDTWNAEHTW